MGSADEGHVQRYAALRRGSPQPRTSYAARETFTFQSGEESRKEAASISVHISVSLLTARDHPSTAEPRMGLPACPKPSHLRAKTLWRNTKTQSLLLGQAAAVPRAHLFSQALWNIQKPSNKPKYVNPISTGSAARAGLCAGSAAGPHQDCSRSRCSAPAFEPLSGSDAAATAPREPSPSPAPRQGSGRLQHLPTRY